MADDEELQAFANESQRLNGMPEQLFLETQLNLKTFSTDGNSPTVDPRKTTLDSTPSTANLSLPTENVTSPSEASSDTVYSPSPTPIDTSTGPTRKRVVDELEDGHVGTHAAHYTQVTAPRKRQRQQAYVIQSPPPSGIGSSSARVATVDVPALNNPSDLHNAGASGMHAQVEVNSLPALASSNPGQPGTAYQVPNMDQPGTLLSQNNAYQVTQNLQPSGMHWPTPVTSTGGNGLPATTTYHLPPSRQLAPTPPSYWQNWAAASNFAASQGGSALVATPPQPLSTAGSPVCITNTPARQPGVQGHAQPAALQNGASSSSSNHASIASAMPIAPVGAVRPGALVRSNSGGDYKAVPCQIPSGLNPNTHTL